LTLTADRADLNALVVCKAFVNRPEVGADESSAVFANSTIQVVWKPTQESFEEKTANGLATTEIVYSGNPTPNLTVTITNGTAVETNVTSLDANKVLVKIVANTTQLPISYVISHNDETIKKGVVVPAKPPTKPTPQGSSNVGTIAGIVIALILTAVCAALLIVMWKKNLLCPKKGSLDVEKAGAASSDGGLSKPVELDEVEPAVHEPVEETKNHTSDPLLDDDDIKKPIP